MSVPLACHSALYNFSLCRLPSGELVPPPCVAPHRCDIWSHAFWWCTQGRGTFPFTPCWCRPVPHPLPPRMHRHKFHRSKDAGLQPQATPPALWAQASHGGTALPFPTLPCIFSRPSSPRAGVRAALLCLRRHNLHSACAYRRGEGVPPTLIALHWHGERVPVPCFGAHKGGEPIPPPRAAAHGRATCSSALC